MIPWANAVFSGNEKKYVMEALDSTWISGGYFVDTLEKEFLGYHETDYGLSVSNGTTALHLALLAAGIKTGDEVIVPGFTFVAPVNMIVACGATPVFAEIDKETWLIDPASIENAITNKTKAIIVVNLYGNVCDMDPICAIAAKHDLLVIEDNAESPFSTYNGRYSGTIGDIGCFSFQATKTITTGEGGFVITKHKELYDEMRIIRDHGMQKDKRYWHTHIGYNFRLTNLQAAIGLAQLEQIDTIIADRQRIYKKYKERLVGQTGIQLQHYAENVDPVVWALVLKIDQKVFNRDRDALIQAMKEKGVETRPGFYPCTVLPLYAEYTSSPFPICEDVAANLISLPFFVSLPDTDIDYICDTLLTLRNPDEI